MLNTMNKLRNQATWAGLLVAAVGLLSSFSDGRPAAKRETRPVGAFTEVSLGGSAHVVLKQGSPQSVVVEASPEALADFETVVEGPKLRLGYRRDGKGSWKMKDRGPVTVYVTAPSLTALRVGGSGKLKVEGDLKAEKMTLAVSGSGELQVPQLTAAALETAVSGSGNLTVAGTAPQHEVRISGSGQVKARDLKSETCQVRISGSGNAHVYASKSADARISGSGGVYVAGGARTSSSTSGSGRVHQE